MATYEEQSQAYQEKFRNMMPASVTDTIDASIASLQDYDKSNIIRVGEKLPAFQLKNATGKEVESTSLLSKGPLVIVFYRGEWCPYCNFAIAGYQKLLPEFKARGVTVVGITPELPNGLLTMAEKHNLEFEILTDYRNEYARKLNIIYKQPDSMRTAFEQMKIPVWDKNDDDSLELPIPTTLLVDQKGVVQNLQADPDFLKRVEPSTVLEWVKDL